jgi:hypothetical protein
LAPAGVRAAKIRFGDDTADATAAVSALLTATGVMVCAPAPTDRSNVTIASRPLVVSFMLCLSLSVRGNRTLLTARYEHGRTKSRELSKHSKKKLKEIVGESMRSRLEVGDWSRANEASE